MGSEKFGEIIIETLTSLLFKANGNQVFQLILDLYRIKSLNETKTLQKQYKRFKDVTLRDIGLDIFLPKKKDQISLVEIIQSVENSLNEDNLQKSFQIPSTTDITKQVDQSNGIPIENNQQLDYFLME